MTAILAATVLVELFTSEGCSSCPPADALVEQLQREQPLAGTQLIFLSEHVDYWNGLGWQDPYSDGAFTSRQSAYGGRNYTPQAVIDGGVDVIGSDRQEILHAAQAAARERHGQLELSRTSGTTVRISVSGLPGNPDAAVMIAVVEDNLVSRVERGENAGRTLRHTAVVRVLREVGHLKAGAPGWTAEVPVPRNDSWKQPRLVAFVQDRKTRRVLAASVLQEQRDGAAAERDKRGSDDQAHGAKQAHAP
jgi:hypothetical protein